MASPNKTRIQVATDPAFSNVVYDVNGAYTTALQIAEEVLPQGVNLYARGMHGHPTTGDSSWSTTVQFQIKLAWSNWDGSVNGLEYSLNNHNPYYISAVKLDETRVCVCYTNGADNSSLYTIVFTISGTSIGLSLTKKCNSNHSYFISSVSLGSGKVCICYYDSNTGYTYAQLIEVRDTDIVLNTRVQISGHRCYDIKAILLENNKIFISYYNNSVGNNVYAQILTVDGAIVYSGAPVQCNGNNSDYVYPVKLDTNRVLVCYRDITTAYRLHAKLLNISGTNIVPGGWLQCSTGHSYSISAVLISPDKVLVCYRNESNAYSLHAQILSISGDVIIASTPVQCNTFDTFHVMALLVNDGSVCVTYRGRDEFYLYAQILTIEDDIIIVGDPVRCTEYSSDWMFPLIVDNYRVCVVYRKVSDIALCGKILVN